MPFAFDGRWRGGPQVDGLRIWGCAGCGGPGEGAGLDVGTEVVQAELPELSVQAAAANLRDLRQDGSMCPPLPQTADRLMKEPVA